MRHFIFDTVRRIENTPIVRGEKNFSNGESRVFFFFLRIRAPGRVFRSIVKSGKRAFLLINERMNRTDVTAIAKKKKKYFSK